jgi:hypothetical protein
MEQVLSALLECNEFGKIKSNLKREKMIKKTKGPVNASIILILLMFAGCNNSEPVTFVTDYFSFTINTEGYITSMKNITVNPATEFCPSDKPSPLLCLYDSKKDAYYMPYKAKFNSPEGTVILKYHNGSTARVNILSKKKYFKMTLDKLTSREEIDDIQWGPYQTNITNLLGDIIGVARDTSETVNYAIGMLALDDITTGGDSRTPGDAPGSKYMIHSPDKKRFPLPDSLHEGQLFSLGGDGISDVAFYSQKAEYFRMTMGNSANVDSLGRINIIYHASDRRNPREILFSLIPFMQADVPNHQVTEPLPGIDFMGSTIAFYGSPDSTALMNVIQDIVLSEGLPYPTLNGKWVKDPARYVPDIITHGQLYDSAVSYVHRLGFKSVYANDQPFFKPDRGNKGYIDGNNFELKPFRFSSGNKSHKEFSDISNPLGIFIGRHTITTALAPGTKDASPVPNDSLCWQQRRILTKNIGPADTLIETDDPRYLEEIASWEGHAKSLNMVKIGKELIYYLGVTTTPPYMLLKVKRGYWNTKAAEHSKGDNVYKLQVTLNYGYDGLIPDMKLQDEIARYYADVCAINGIYFLDHDGQEFLYDQGHGNYSVKRFFRAFRERCKYYKIPYIRLTGAGLSEGSWHYQSIFNVGGGSNMYDLKTREWGSSTSEGKDIRNGTFSNFFPATFGGNFNIGPESTVEQFEHIQAISVGVGVTYSLNINQKDVENCPQKEAIFRTIRTWEDARAANAFPRSLKKKLSDPSKEWTLESNDKNTWVLYRRINGVKKDPIVLTRAQGY